MDDEEGKIASQEKKPLDGSPGEEQEESDDDALFSLDDIDDLLGDDEGDESTEDLLTLDESSEEADGEESGESDESSRGKFFERLGFISTALDKVNRFLLKIFGPFNIISKPLRVVFKFFSTRIRAVLSKAKQTFVHIKQSVPRWAGLSKKKGKDILRFVREKFVAFKALNLKKKVAALVLVSLVVVFLLLLNISVLGGRWIPILNKPILKSLEEVATTIKDYKPKTESEYLHSAFRQPYYTYLLDGIVINLRPSFNSTKLPMARVEIFLTLDSTETAIEVKDRRSEIKDYVARIFEEATYDELISSYGKKKIKINIKSKLNEVLNHGMVREVLFKEIIHKR